MEWASALDNRDAIWSKSVKASQALLALGWLSISLSAADAADRTYLNPRFGTTITYPDAIFTKQSALPENGDGARWIAPDGAELAVWGQNNVLGSTPESLADEVAATVAKVTYRKVGARFMVVSGFDGNIIVYHRAEIGSNDVIHSMELRYPASVSKHYDVLAGKIADSLIGP